MSDRSAPAILQESFLEVRAKLLEIAATLDRIDRADESVNETSVAAKRAQIDEAIQILLQDESTRASDLQLLFSRQYDSTWRTQMDV